MGKPYKPRKLHGGDACEKRFSPLNRSQKNGFALKKRLRKLYTLEYRDCPENTPSLGLSPKIKEGGPHSFDGTPRWGFMRTFQPISFAR